MKAKCLLIVMLVVLVFSITAGSKIEINTGKGDQMKGNKEIVTMEREVTPFHSVKLAGVGNVQISFSETPKVVVTTDSNLQEVVLVETKNEVLIITLESKKSIKPSKLELEVWLPKLQKVQISGVGDVNIAAGKAESLDITLSGVGSLKAAEYEVENVEIKLSGVGSASIWASQSLSGTLSGVGSLKYKGDPQMSVRNSGVGSVKKVK